MEQIILSQISVNDLQTIIRDSVKAEIQELVTKATIPKVDEELLTLKEACEFLKVSKVTLHKWMRTGQIHFLRFGNRIRFKKSELLFASESRVSKLSKRTIMGEGMSTCKVTADYSSLNQKR